MTKRLDLIFYIAKNHCLSIGKTILVAGAYGCGVFVPFCSSSITIQTACNQEE